MNNGKHNLFLTTILCLSITATVAQTKLSNEAQIKTAVLAAPEGLRDKATIFGYSGNGEFIVLRKGTNELVCLADDSFQDGLSVSCYHKDLEPFMSRGRELKKEGKSFKDVFEIREAEVKSGKLKMPAQPTTLFAFSAAAGDVDMTTGEVKGGNLRYVIYIPYATAESTGLPLKPEAPGMPWIMDPGTHRAHIMITPPAKEHNH
ncbi:MAG: hypothetical protein WKF87_14025 [Chryseolinea sp.]